MSDFIIREQKIQLLLYVIVTCISSKIIKSDSCKRLLLLVIPRCIKTNGNQNYYYCYRILLRVNGAFTSMKKNTPPQRLFRQFCRLGFSLTKKLTNGFVAHVTYTCIFIIITSNTDGKSIVYKMLFTSQATVTNITYKMLSMVRLIICTHVFT